MAGGVAPPPALASLTDGAAWTRIAAGEAGGAVWRLEWAERGPAYLKHGQGRVADDIADEAVRLRWLAGRASVPAVRLFVCTHDEAWLLSDAMPGWTRDDSIAQDPEAWPRVVRGSAN